jgi:hypothetical protein
MGKKRCLNILCPFEGLRLESKYCVCMIITFVGGYIFFVLKLVVLDIKSVKLIHMK